MEGGWSLPSIEIPAAHKWWRETLAVNEAVAERYSLDTIVLRCLAIYHPWECVARTAVYLVQNRDERRAPRGGTYIHRQQLEEIQFADLRQRALVLEALSESSEGDSGQRMPWEEPGWFERAAAWMEDEARSQRYALTGPIVQVRNHGYTSCLLRAPTAKGPLYLKACPSMWPQEPQLTAALAGRYGNVTPIVVAAQPEERWLLTLGFDGQKLNQLGDRDRYLVLWEALLTQFGHMQIEYAHHTEHLTRLGCPDWRLDRLFPFVRRFLLELVPAIDWEGADSPWSRATLESLAERLEEACESLATYDIPATLHHGDFHSANILTDGASCRVVDWAFQAGIAHPFFFMSVVFEEHVDPPVRTRLRDRYLRLWTDREPMERLVEAFELAQPLALLHAAMGHHVQLQNGRMAWETGPDREAIRYYVTYLAQCTGE
jgi:hypothetical protein